MSAAESPSLGDLLTAASRRGSEGQLRAMAVAGLAGTVTVVALIGRRGWLYAALMLAIGAYGVWAILDRRLQRMYATLGASRPRERALEAARFVVGLVAAVAGMSALAAIFLPMIGFWKS